MTTLAVVTIVRGRHDHLARQHRSLARGTRLPDLVVVVAMDDVGVRDVVAEGPLHDVTSVVDVHVPMAGLPLARARNVGAEQALAEGADLLVLLDVDCLATPSLLERYERADADLGGRALLCGPVSYLPQPLPPGVDDVPPGSVAPHPGRPAPKEGVLTPADVKLFWSLSFAVRDTTWRAIGGFDASYVGYGAEDTDFGQKAARAGTSMWWVGGALAHHQWHPTSDPPVEHVHDIVRNANLFEHRWGWFPMGGWLEEFARRGLVVRAEGSWRAAVGPAASSGMEGR